MLKRSTSPKVSVCLPVYNGAKYLAAAIESVLSQDLLDWELLIFDDGSSDDSPKMAEKFEKKDKRIVFKQNPERLGLFGNYNACMKEAKGSFIKPFAQDDVLEPEALSQMVSVLEDHPEIAMVSCSKWVIDDEGKETQLVTTFPEDRTISGKEVIGANLVTLSNWVGEPSAVMFRAKSIGDGFDTKYYHYGDIEYWFRILEKSSLFYLRRTLYSFRRHKESSTSANLAGLYFASDIFRLYDRYKNYLSELGESEEHFGNRATEYMALLIDHLVREENLDANAVPIANPRRDTNVKFSDAAVFRTALFHSLRRVTSLMRELITTQNELEHREGECKQLREHLDQLNRSVSWKVTTPLRAVREMIKRPD